MRSLQPVVVIVTGAVVLVQFVLGSPVPMAKERANQTPAFDAVRLSNAADSAAAVDSSHGSRAIAPQSPAITKTEGIARGLPGSDAELGYVPDWDNKKRMNDKHKRVQHGPEDIESRGAQGDCLTCLIKRFFVALVEEKGAGLNQAGTVFKPFTLGSRQPVRAVHSRKRATTSQVKEKDTAQTGSTFKPFTLGASRSFCATCLKRIPPEVDEASKRDSPTSAKRGETDWYKKARGFITVDKKSESGPGSSTVAEESTTWDDKIRKIRGHIAADKRSGSASDDSILEKQGSTSWDNRIRKPRGHIAADGNKEGASGDFDVAEDMQRANKD